MLVLSRGTNEGIVVGDDVKVTLLAVHIGEAVVRGATVKLGFEAPDDVCILRQEVLDRQNSKSVSSGRNRPKPKSKPDVSGKRLPVHDAVVRLQIEAPRQIAIHCSRASESTPGRRRLVQTVRIESNSADQEQSTAPPPIRVITCRKGDNLLVGNHLLIAIVDIVRFVANQPLARSGSSCSSA